MRYKDQRLEVVRISRRTLWIGMQAYPLQGVACVRPLYYIPDRAATVWTFAKGAGTWTAFAVVGWLVLAYLGSSAPTGANVVLVLAVLGILVPHTIRLVRGLTEPKLYAMSVETAGAPHNVLVSRSEDQIYDLIRRVVDAIDNPTAEFEMKVENVVIGDKIDGDKFIGDKKITY